MVLTDIDAALFNRRWGTLGLFQLKWQDMFGSSMRQRESQRRNLLATGNKWIETMSSWLEDKSPHDIGLELGLKAKDAKSIKNIMLFVIGRNAAHFSGPEEPDPRAVWGLWPQLQRLASQKTEISDPIV